METMATAADAHRQRVDAEKRCLQAEGDLARGQQTWFESLDKMREQLRLLATENKANKGGLRSMIWSRSQPKPAVASMDDEFRVAQDFAAIFKSVVEPLELEIKLRRAAEKDPSAEIVALRSAVESSARLRADMEQQLLVLNSQKYALQVATVAHLFTTPPPPALRSLPLLYSHHILHLLSTLTCTNFSCNTDPHLQSELDDVSEQLGRGTPCL